MQNLHQGSVDNNMAAAKRIELFYDVLSPYTWFAFEVACRYRPIWKIPIDLRPAFLGGIMKGSGNSPPMMVPNKGAYMHPDLVRCARYFDVPLRNVSDPVRAILTEGSLPAQRFLVSIQLSPHSEKLEAATRELWMRRWNRDESIIQTSDHMSVCEAIGIPVADAESIVSRVEHAEVKNALKANTEAALEGGSFGMPWFVLHHDNETETIFGSDRMPLIADIMGLPWHGPTPTRKSNM